MSARGVGQEAAGVGIRRHGKAGLALALCGGLAALLSFPAQAAEFALRGPVSPTVAAVQADRPPKIDGRLDDECWKTATHMVGFWRLDNGAPEYEPTEAWICYDREKVYIAWYCHDSEPGKIVEEQKKRGGSLVSDDWVGVDLDVDFDKQDPYWFDVSAGGTQADYIPGGAAAKIEWRGDWQAATSRVSDGWQAEMALPLSMFRYPKGQSTFGFVLIRRLAKEDDWSVWPSIGPGFELTRQAVWNGLTLPPPKQGPVIMPYALLETGDTENKGVTAGLDVKHRLQNGLEGMFTYNPDFRDVEDVVETIDFTYVERYLPEYRPFFLEGGGYGPSSRLFYSRRIPDFDAGLKVFGKTGRHALGALVSEEFGQANNIVLNERYSLTPCRSVNAGLVSHQSAGEPDDLAYSLGTNQRFPSERGERSYWATWEGSRPEGGQDGSYVAGGWSDSHRTGPTTDTTLEIGGESISRDYRPALGYVPETDLHQEWLNYWRRNRHDSGPVLAQDWYSYAHLGGAEKGRRWEAGTGSSIQWRNQRGASLEFGGGSRDGFSEHTVYAATSWRNRDIYRSGDITFHYGERLERPYRYLSLSQGAQLAARLAVRLRAEHIYASELDENGIPTPASSRQQYVLGLTYDMTWEKSVSARLVKRNDGTNWYAAYRQKVRSGTDVWMIVGDPNTPSFTRRLAIKVVRVF